MNDDISKCKKDGKMKSHNLVVNLRYQETDADPLKMILPPATGKQFASRKLDQVAPYVLEHCEKDKGYTKRKKAIQSLIKEDPFYSIVAGKKLYEVEFLFPPVYSDEGAVTGGTTNLALNMYI